MKQLALEKLLRFTKQFIRLRTYGHLWNALKKLHYADIAALIENLTASERSIIIQLLFNRKLDISKIAEIISELVPDVAVELLSQLEINQTVAILETLSSDDAAHLIGLFEDYLQIEILKKMKREDSDDIQEQLAYPEESAGRVMSSDFLALDEQTTAGNAITAIQLAGEEVEVPFYLYVIDEEQRLKGVVSLKQIILVNKNLKLKEIMNTDVYKVDVFTDQEEVAAAVANYNLLAIPVVDELDKLVGVVTVDDVIDIIHDEATEDIYKLAGVHLDYNTNLTIFQSIRKRIPWLLLGLITTAFGAFVISFFTDNIKDFVLLAVFMPIVAAIGGVVGNQGVAIMVREIIVGNLEWQKSKRILLKEFAVGLFSGIGIGILAGVISYFLSGYWFFGLIFGGAIIINLAIGALVGTLIPIVLKSLKLDPALASGIVVTMLTDITGYVSFLGLAALIIPRFMPG
jgi:magnesium transporter